MVTLLKQSSIDEEQPKLIDEEAVQKRARMFALLSQPIRLQLLALLLQSEGTMCVLEIVQCFEREQPTISHHLRLLGDLGLLGHHKKGLYTYYFVRPERVVEVCGYLEGL